MKSIDCGTAEILAGAIALGEAGDAERDGYRRHLSTCERCVRACGGEREIERVMATIARAREQESWEPDLRAALRDRSRMRRGAWIGGIGAGVAAALAASVGIHALLLTTAHPISLVASGSLPNQTIYRVALETRPKAARSIPRALAAPAAVPQPVRIVHHVVALAKPPQAARASGRLAPRPVQDPAVVAALPPSARDERSIAAMQTVQTMAPAYSHQAESIAMGPREIVVRDVAPLPGSMPAPNPAPIAASELAAEGLAAVTTVYAVAVDDRGLPTSCSIEKPSGILAIDEAVCKAAMRARFSPRTIDGRATPSTYRDAYVFLRQ